MIISLFVSMLIFLLLGFTVNKMYTYSSEQFIREHVVSYGNMAITELYSLIKQGNEIELSNLQGMTRIKIKYPDKSVDVVSVNPQRGFFINEKPMLGQSGLFGSSDVNYFKYDPDNSINYEISEFNCDYVPATTGLFGKLTETMYRIHIKIDVIRKVKGHEIITEFNFKNDVFAVAEYL